MGRRTRMPVLCRTHTGIGIPLPMPPNCTFIQGALMTLDLRDPPEKTLTRQPIAPPWRLWLLRLGVIAISLVLWFWTQSLLGSRPVPAKIGAALHDWTASGNSYFLSHP